MKKTILILAMLSLASEVQGCEKTNIEQPDSLPVCNLQAKVVWLAERTNKAYKDYANANSNHEKNNKWSCYLQALLSEGKYIDSCANQDLRAIKTPLSLEGCTALKKRHNDLYKLLREIIDGAIEAKDANPPALYTTIIMPDAGPPHAFTQSIIEQELTKLQALQNLQAKVVWLAERTNDAYKDYENANSNHEKNNKWSCYLKALVSELLYFDHCANQDLRASLPLKDSTALKKRHNDIDKLIRGIGDGTIEAKDAQPPELYTTIIMPDAGPPHAFTQSIIEHTNLQALQALMDLQANGKRTNDAYEYMLLVDNNTFQTMSQEEQKSVLDLVDFLNAESEGIDQFLQIKNYLIHLSPALQEKVKKRKSHIETLLKTLLKELQDGTIKPKNEKPPELISPSDTFNFDDMLKFEDNEDF